MLRAGQRLSLSLTLRNPAPSVPVSMGATRPAYLILNGAVLLQFTEPLLYLRDLPRPRGNSRCVGLAASCTRLLKLFFFVLYCVLTN